MTQQNPNDETTCADCGAWLLTGDTQPCDECSTDLCVTCAPICKDCLGVDEDDPEELEALAHPSWYKQEAV